MQTPTRQHRLRSCGRARLLVACRASVCRPPLAGWPRYLLCEIVLGALAACQAEPPMQWGGASVPAIGTDRYASVAVASCRMVASCPGPTCARDLVTGAPDGRAINLTNDDCYTLDVVFNGGTIIARRGVPDVVIHLGRVDDTSIARVEASHDGSDYQLVAFINGPPSNTNSSCLATFLDAGAVIDLTAGERLDGTTVGGCNLVSNVNHFRITRYDDGQGLLEIDAIEAVAESYRPLGTLSPSLTELRSAPPSVHFASSTARSDDARQYGG